MKRSAWIALLLIYLSMVGTALVSDKIFDHLPHLEDEFTYLYQARLFEKGETSIRAEQPIRATWQPFLITVDGNKRFGKYPPGWPMLLAMGTALDVPWVVNLWFGGLIVALVYRFGRELYDDVAGVVGALLMTISPIALLLNGTLMSHTTALFFTLLFIYSLWRLEKKRHVYGCGALAGFALGMLVANRPLVSVAVAAPFILYSLLRLLWLLGRGLYAYRIAGGQQKRLGASLSEFTFALKPLVVLGLIAILYALLFPASNYAVVGDPADNLYTRIWSYDTIGFGEGHGRYSGREIYKLADNGIKIYMRSYTGHSPDRGWRNTKRDFKCYSRDLFGWVRQPDDPPREPKLGNDCLMDSPGYSWALLPFSALFLLITTPLLPGKTSFRRWASYGWRFLEKSRWTVLLLAVAGCIILVQILYWIGAGIYSARYYYEATAALAIVSGAGISGLARFADYFRLRYGVYALLGLAVAFSVIGYSPKRLDPLRGYGRVTRAPLEQMEAMRLSPDTPVLVVAYGNHHWRDLAPFMALTDPHTENEIIGLRDPDANTLDDLIKRYPDRQVFLIVAQKLMLYDPENLPDPPEAGG